MSVPNNDSILDRREDTGGPSPKIPTESGPQFNKEENQKAMRGGPTKTSWKTPAGDEISIKSVRILALWSIKIGLNETCPICREQLQGLCVQCLAGSDDSQTCRVAQLPCGHLFHHHCVSQWLLSRDAPVCPTCQAAIYSLEDIKMIV